MLMPYKKFHLYLASGENFNIEKSIRIFNRFLDGLENSNIEYPNYNHYTEIPNNRITFRADMSNEAFIEATQIAEALQIDHEISHFSPSEANPPIFVKAAHELASKCVLELFNNRISFREEMNRDSLWCLMNFFKKLLEKIDYELYITWDIERHYLGGENRVHRERIVTLANSCEDYIVAKRELFTNPDFFERFIHLFFNCSLINFEKQFWQYLSRFKTIESLSESFKDNDE
jgi:hypothetical protein